MPAEGQPSRIEKLLGQPPGPRVGLGFSARTTVAAALSLLVAWRLGVQSPVWAVVSAVVVIQPEVRASVSSAVLRVVANLVGAAVGFAVSLLDLHPLVSLAIALPGTVLLCRLTGLDLAARTACVAVVIVLLKDPFDVSASSHVRVALVALGCFVALVVTAVAARLEAMPRRDRG